MPFSKEQLRQRIERFTLCMEKQEGLTCQQADTQERSKHPYIVSNATGLAMVIFTSTGGVKLTAPAGKLKELILTWVAQEGCPYYDSSTPGELTKQDNPLVELAELVGLSVYLIYARLAACRREGSRGPASGTASAHVIDGTRRGREQNTIPGRTPSVMMRSMGCKAAVARRLGPEDGMEALEIESQTDQTPLASRRQFAGASENWRKPNTYLIMPITGSTVHLRAP